MGLQHSHQAASGHGRKAANRVTVVGMLLDLLLGAAKCLGGWLFHSQALFVDGVHSFSDAFSDLGVLLILRVSRQGPDARHPYGHQRFETLGTLLLGAVLIAVAGALAWENLLWLWQSGADLPLPGWPVLLIALLSIAGKEWIFRYTRRVGKQIGSALLLANAWHSRSDALSSVLVLVAVLGAWLGLPWLDGVAAVLIALIVGKIGWDFVWQSVRELVDTGLPEAQLQQINQLAGQVDGVRGIHDLRSRRMGDAVLLECHIQVAPTISVSEGHHIGMQLVERVRAALPEVGDMVFHVDPENDQAGAPTDWALPSRTEVQALLADAWAPLLALGPGVRLGLHYLNNQVDVDVMVLDPTALVAEHGAVSQAQLQQRVQGFAWLGQVRLWQRASQVDANAN